MRIGRRPNIRICSSERSFSTALCGSEANSSRDTREYAYIPWCWNQRGASPGSTWRVKSTATSFTTRTLTTVSRVDSAGFSGQATVTQQSGCREGLGNAVGARCRRASHHEVETRPGHHLRNLLAVGSADNTPKTVREESALQRPYNHFLAAQFKKRLPGKPRRPNACGYNAVYIRHKSNNAT